LAPGRALGLCPRCLLARAALGTEAEPSGFPPTVPELAAVAAAFPQLEVLELVGRGGMGVVYRARQKSLNRMVALKLLAPGREQDPAFAERFAKEARALAALSHPNIVTVHDFGFAPAPAGAAGEGFYFLLMEFVDGVNLRQAMQAGRFTPEQALAIVPPVCGALQFAHERGIVHRDIKPENLLLDKDGRIKIADFGIAKMLETGGAELPLGRAAASPRVAETDPAGTPTPSAFTAQTAAGTPQYMAPEQRDQSGKSDHRADIYSLGVVLYELLTGELPGARLEPPSHRVQIDVRLDEIVLRALKAKPELRYQTAGEFSAQVETVASAPDEASTAGPEEVPPVTRVLRSSRSYFTTGKHMDSFWRKYIYMYGGQGRLTLDSDRLTFVGTNGETVIPLGAIVDLRLGEYPRFMKPHGLNFIRVTFEERGRTQCLCFVPNEGAWEPTWDTNSFIADWLAAIREAVAARKDRAPAVKLPRRQSPSTTPPVPKFANGLLTTPENLTTFEGQFFIRRARGQLLLDEHQLTHACDRGTTVIPLAAIRDVSIGEYPATMNPAGIDLLSVTYEDQGGLKQVYVSPMDGWFALPSTWNARVADWHAALRNAVARATGKEPAETPRDNVSVPRGHNGLRAFMLMAFVMPALAVFLILNLRNGGPGSGNLFTPLAFIVFMLLGGFFGQRLIWRLFRKRPPSARGIAQSSRRLGAGLLVLGCLIPLIAVVYVITTPPAFRATLLFKIDDTVTWLSFPEFWRNSLNQNKALSLQPIRLTRMFAVHGDAATPAEAVQQVNDALGLIQSDAIGSKLELIDPPIMPGRAIRPKSPLALVVGIAGFLFLGLPGIWLIRRGVFVLLVILIPVAVLGGLVLVSYLSLQQPAPPVPVGIDR
jgi:serine/threonine protein kinase